MQRHSFQALNSTFVVDSEYQYVKELGQGAYGCVVAAKHRRSGESCAIKKITNINTKVRPPPLALLVRAHPPCRGSSPRDVSGKSSQSSSVPLRAITHS